MNSVTKTTSSMSLSAYRGDAKTLLAFNLPSKNAIKSLAGFTVKIRPEGNPAYYLHNTLQFEKPGDHAQDTSESANASINAPIHKFRWVHVPGSIHQGVAPFFGKYAYTVTPRYFDGDDSLLPLDPDKSVTVSIEVSNFQKKGIELGFTRGFVQSQAFVQHFGQKALIRPKTKELLFDTSQISGADANGNQYTFAQQYEWLGFTARKRIFDLLKEVLEDKRLRLDVFAYDFNEPEIAQVFLKLARQGRIRVILDNAALHHSAASPTSEDEFESLFVDAAKGNAAMVRGRFGRYAHDKIFIVSNASGAKKVLTGSTNFSINGLYVNSNHVIVFSDKKIVTKYAELFEAVWAGKAKRAAYVREKLSSETFVSSPGKNPLVEVTFAPHSEEFASQILDGIADRIGRESRKGTKVGSVLFAVMAVDNGVSPVYNVLKNVHSDDRIFSFGISDSKTGIALYKPGAKRGVLVTGKPGATLLPPPFNQVGSIGSGHQIHHKFVICGFNTADAVVYCGSSNLALGGEIANGDNLLAIRDRDIATIFAIEALCLVDHFQFLNNLEAKAPSQRKRAKAPVSKKQAALDAGWYLSTTDRWARPYFDPKDLHCVDRLLFA